MSYGEGPKPIKALDLDWQEFMHYLYLPVLIPESDSGNGQRALPKRLTFLEEALDYALDDAFEFEHLQDPYVYVTARRGFATPGNPLNRPGWHCDDFGGADLNYIWSDAYPTRWLRNNTGQEVIVPEDDAESMRYFESMADHADNSMMNAFSIVDTPLKTLLRLSPYVIHDTPIIPPPGGMRSFLKISVSTHRYDLIGNSHNYELDYDWPMVSREEMRNQPNGNKDYSA